MGLNADETAIWNRTIILIQFGGHCNDKYYICTLTYCFLIFILDSIINLKNSSLYQFEKSWPFVNLKVKSLNEENWSVNYGWKTLPSASTGICGFSWRFSLLLVSGDNACWCTSEDADCFGFTTRKADASATPLREKSRGPTPTGECCCCTSIIVLGKFDHYSLQQSSLHCTRHPPLLQGACCTTTGCQRTMHPYLFFYYYYSNEQ